MCWWVMKKAKCFSCLLEGHIGRLRMKMVGGPAMGTTITRLFELNKKPYHNSCTFHNQSTVQAHGDAKNHDHFLYFLLLLGLFLFVSLLACMLWWYIVQCYGCAVVLLTDVGSIFTVERHALDPFLLVGFARCGRWPSSSWIGIGPISVKISILCSHLVGYYMLPAQYIFWDI